MWLIPRLGRFRQVDPQLSIKVETGNTLADLDRDSRIDLAIQATLRTFPTLPEIALIDEYFGAYAATGFDAHRSDERLDLIETVWDTPLPMSIDWALWCHAVFLRHCDDEHYALQAVLHGQGVGLLSSVRLAGCAGPGGNASRRSDGFSTGSKRKSRARVGRSHGWRRMCDATVRHFHCAATCANRSLPETHAIHRR